MTALGRVFGRRRTGRCGPALRPRNLAQSGVRRAGRRSNRSRSLLCQAMSWRSYGARHGSSDMSWRSYGARSGSSDMSWSVVCSVDPLQPRGAAGLFGHVLERRCRAGPVAAASGHPGAEDMSRKTCPCGQIVCSGPVRGRLSAKATAPSLSANLGVRGPAGGPTESSASLIAVSTPTRTQARPV